MNRITPDQIDYLKDHEIFVFGSNEAGRHGKGAAKTAMKWGAHYGQAKGLQGKTYAIPTMNASISHKLDITKIKKYVEVFIEFAKERRDLTFFVTEIGCGLAGFSHKDIAPLFEGCKDMLNVYLPAKFRRIIGND